MLIKSANTNAKGTERYGKNGSAALTKNLAGHRSESKLR